MTSKYTPYMLNLMMATKTKLYFQPNHIKDIPPAVAVAVSKYMVKAVFSNLENFRYFKPLTWRELAEQISNILQMLSRSLKTVRGWQPIVEIHDVNIHNVIGRYLYKSNSRLIGTGSIDTLHPFQQLLVAARFVRNTMMSLLSKNVRTVPVTPRHSIESQALLAANSELKRCFSQISGQVAHLYGMRGADSEEPQVINIAVIYSDSVKLDEQS